MLDITCTFQFNPEIRGFTYGLRFENIVHRKLKIFTNQFYGGKYGVYYATSGNNGIEPDAYLIQSNKFFEGSTVLLNGSYNVKFLSNEFSGNGFANPVGTTYNLMSYYKGNVFTSENTNFSQMKMSNGLGGNSFCCNSFNTSLEGLQFYGTNPVSSLNVSTFSGSGLTLEQAMIGENAHKGNRWKGGTSKGTLLGSEPILNRFTFRNSQGSQALGAMRPVLIEPIFQANDWFRPDPTGTAPNDCSNECGIKLPGIPGSTIGNNVPLSPPDSIANLGPCYPASLDRDGDGICDPLDPHPNDPCLPIALDVDGDGICDPIDPDPTSPCNPIGYDSDNDGICDTVDPDPLNPCIPTGVDSDGDGVCDALDPAPTNPNPYIFPPQWPGSWTNSDGNGDYLPVEGYSSLGYLYDIEALENIVSLTTGLSDYDELNYVESMSFLYYVLRSSPYYRIVSNKLNTAYNNIHNTSIASYANASRMEGSLFKTAKSLDVQLTKSELLLNRFKNVAAQLKGTTSQDSIYRLVMDSVYSQQVAALNLLQMSDQTNSQNKIAAFTNIVNNLPIGYHHHVALKEYYQIFVSHILGKAPLTSANISSLLSIANSCPLKYGEAVHRSRALLIGTDLYVAEDFADNCNSPSLRAKSSENQVVHNNNFDLQPNPTFGQIKIADVKGIEQINILGIDGQLLRIISKDEIQSKSIDLLDLNNSLLFLEAIMANGERIVKKIIVVR